MYQWIVLLHVVGAFVFVASHGVAIWMAFRISRERDRARIGALLDLSSASLSGLYVGLLMLLVGGIWAGIVGDWFRFGWIWLALGLLVAITILMYVIATPFFGKVRNALGQRTMQTKKTDPDPPPVPDEELQAIVARTPVALLSAIGTGGLLIILWLMVLKPF
ncbi:MAG TPA: hypothetical protein VFY18_09830 [Candidatus Limnocylindrales bacterium]|nr:hypothetical protein [Candidatus Limnocylindrales bacterium]